MLFATFLFSPLFGAAAPVGAIGSLEPLAFLQEGVPGEVSPWARDFTESLEEARRVYLVGLEGLADWCQKNNAFACRNLALESLLHFQSGHPKARKTLRYRFDRKTDSWVRRGTYRAPADRSSAAALEYLVRRDALDAVFVGKVIDAIETAEGNLGPAKTFTELRNLYAVAPLQPRLLERLGFRNAAEEGEPPRWVSVHSLNTLARRAELQTWLAEALEAAAKIEDATPDGIDLSINVEWRQARSISLTQASSVRAIARLTAEEADRDLAVAATSLGFLAHLVGEKPELGAPWTIYLLDRPEDTNRFIDSYPGLDDDQRTRARLLASMWMPGKTRCGVWGVDPEERADQVCKQVAVRFLDSRFGIKTKRGWLVEALGLYINRLVVGTRLSRHVAVTEYSKPGEVPVSLGMEDPDADWLAIAAVTLADMETRFFARALGRNTSEMTSEDVVVTYALVAFLCEGADPGALKYILEQVGSDAASSVAAIEAYFGLPLFEVQLQLRAWLEDVLAVAPEAAETTGR